MTALTLTPIKLAAQKTAEDAMRGLTQPRTLCKRADS